MLEWGASVHATSHSRVLSVCSGVIPCTVRHWPYRLGDRACEPAHSRSEVMAGHPLGEPQVLPDLYPFALRSLMSWGHDPHTQSYPTNEGRDPTKIYHKTDTLTELARHVIPFSHGHVTGSNPGQRNRVRPGFSRFLFTWQCHKKLVRDQNRPGRTNYGGR